MKKNTFITGTISCFLFLFGFILKVMHWPGAGITLTISAALFVFGYSILLFIDKNKIAQNDFQKFVNIMTLLTMMIVMVSFLFKVMHWPGAGIGIYASHFLLLAMIPVLFLQASRETDPVKKLNFSNIAILFVFLTTSSFFIWLVIGSH